MLDHALRRVGAHNVFKRPEAVRSVRWRTNERSVIPARTPIDTDSRWAHRHHAVLQAPRYQPPVHGVGGEQYKPPLEHRRCRCGPKVHRHKQQRQCGQEKPQKHDSIKHLWPSDPVVPKPAGELTRLHIRAPAGTFGTLGRRLATAHCALGAVLGIAQLLLIVTLGCIVMMCRGGFMIGCSLHVETASFIGVGHDVCSL